MNGGNWSIVRDLFAGLKVMGLPRANKLIRSTLTVSPCETSVRDRVRRMRQTCESHLCPHDVEGRLRRTSLVWDPIIEEKVKAGVLTRADLIPVTAGSDATPIPSRPRYCWRRNIIIGLCGPDTPDHKCSLESPPQIANGEEGFHQIVELVCGHVWASYIYTHILQPQVDWLPPMHAHMYCTCNKFDHLPHLQHFWTQIKTKFLRVMSQLQVMLTGKGADGDSRERSIFLQAMYSRWRRKQHPRRSIFSAPKAITSTWIGFPGGCTNHDPHHFILTLFLDHILTQIVHTCRC